MSRVVLGFMVIGIAIVLMLVPTLTEMEGNWPFILGLWVGVLGLMLINSTSREEDQRRKEIFEQRMREREKQRQSEEDGDEEAGNGERANGDSEDEDRETRKR